MGSLYGRLKYDLRWNEANGLTILGTDFKSVPRELWPPDTATKIEAYMQCPDNTRLRTVRG